MVNTFFAYQKLGQDQIIKKIESCDGNNNKVCEQALALLEFAKKVYKIFTGSKIDEKRQILKTVFLNPEVIGDKLKHRLAFPFDKLLKISNCR